jgi:integrase
MATPPKTSRLRRFGTVIPREVAGGRIVWRAKWREPGRRRPERWFDTEEDAQRFLDEIEKTMILGTYVRPPTALQADVILAAEPASGVPFFSEYARKFLNERIIPHRETGTVHVYEAALKSLSDFLDARSADGSTVPVKRIDEIDEDVVLDYRTWRRSHPRQGKHEISNATINRDMQFLSLVLTHAANEGVIAENPIRHMKMLKEPRAPRRWLAKPEAATLIRKADPDFRVFLLIALYTGCRRGEILALRWRDIDLAAKKIMISRQKDTSNDALDLHPEVARELA